MGARPLCSRALPPENARGERDIPGARIQSLGAGSSPGYLSSLTKTDIDRTCVRACTYRSAGWGWTSIRRLLGRLPPGVRETS